MGSEYMAASPVPATLARLQYTPYGSEFTWPLFHTMSYEGLKDSSDDRVLVERCCSPRFHMQLTAGMLKSMVQGTAVEEGVINMYMELLQVGQMFLES